MKEIELTQGKFALVDDDNYDYLMQWKWCVTSCGNRFYAMRAVKDNGKNIYIYLHRLIMKTPINLFVDHVDHNTLNCQKYNMRNCTRQENSQNRKAWNYGTSIYLGVSFNKERNLFRADIRNIHLGYFSNEIDAAKTYDLKAKEIYGEFANLNF